MEVPRVPVRVLEPETAFAEIDLAGNAGVHHPLQRAVDGGAADALVLTARDVEQVVRAEVSLLSEEHIENEVTLARALGARRAEPLDVGDRGDHASDVTQGRGRPSACSDRTRRWLRRTTATSC